MRPSGLHLIAIALLVVVLGMLIVERTIRGKSEKQEASDSPEIAAPPLRESEPTAIGDREQRGREVGDSISGWVHTESGDPIAKARITLTLATSDDAQCEPVWRESDWGPLARDIQGTESGADGAFSFAELRGGVPHGAVLWASHPAF